MYLLAQFFGLIALFLLVYSYQSKKKKRFLFLQLFSNIFYGLQYFLLNAFSAFGTNIIGIFRTFIFYNYSSKDKKNPTYWFVIFIFIYVIIGIITYDSVLSLIPILVAFLYTYGTWQKDLKITYIIGIIVAILWIIFNTFIGAYVSTITSIIELIASIIGYKKIKKTTYIK